LRLLKMAKSCRRAIAVLNTICLLATTGVVLPELAFAEEEAAAPTPAPRSRMSRSRTGVDLSGHGGVERRVAPVELPTCDVNSKPGEPCSAPGEGGALVNIQRDFSSPKTSESQGWSTSQIGGMVVSALVVLGLGGYALKPKAAPPALNGQPLQQLSPEARAIIERDERLRLAQLASEQKQREHELEMKKEDTKQKQADVEKARVKEDARQRQLLLQQQRARAEEDVASEAVSSSSRGTRTAQRGRGGKGGGSGSAGNKDDGDE
jgi:hypothetical protein